MRHQRLWIQVLILTFTGLPQLSYGSSITPEDLIKKVDRLYRSDTSFTEMEMVIQTPHWQRTLRFESWTRGKNDTFIHILSPKKETGITTLRKGTAMWNFFPKINKVIKVPPSMRMGSWMGSDFTNDDLAKESTLLDEYTVDWEKPVDADPEFWHLRLTPKAQTATVWGKITLQINKKNSILYEQTFFDEKGLKMRTMTLSQIKELGGKNIPTLLTLTPETKEGYSTKIKYLKAKFDIPLKDFIFSRRNLQRKR